MENSSITSLVNGKEQNTISVFDRGMHYGDGLFETMAVRKGKIPLWGAHWARLSEGCERLLINVPTREKLEKDIKILCDNEDQLVIKLIVTRGETKRGYQFTPQQQATTILLKYPWLSYPESYYKKGVAVRYCETLLSENKRLAGLKHLNRLEQILARNEWDTDDFQEGLMLTAKGEVIDGTMSNIFAIKDKILFTPKLSFCGVAGVMRKTVIDLAKQLGFRVSEKNMTPEELQSADEIFLTNSLIGIWPVIQLVEKTLSVGEITKKISIKLNERLGVA